MSYHKGKRKFRKAFRHLKRVNLTPEQLVQTYALKGMYKALLKMCKGAQDGAGVGGGVSGDGEGGPPAPGGNAGSGIWPPTAAPDTPFSLSATEPDAPEGGGYGTGYGTSPDAVATGYMGMTTADLGSIRQASKRFEQGHKHISQFYVHDVVRQQAADCNRAARNLMMGLYGGLSTDSEPRV